VPSRAWLVRAALVEPVAPEFLAVTQHQGQAGGSYAIRRNGSIRSKEAAVRATGANLHLDALQAFGAASNVGCPFFIYVNAGIDATASELNPQESPRSDNSALSGVRIGIARQVEKFASHLHLSLATSAGLGKISAKVYGPNRFLANAILERIRPPASLGCREPRVALCVRMAFTKLSFFTAAVRA